MVEAISAMLSVYLILMIGVVSTVTETQILRSNESQNPCTSKGTCHECIQNPSCAWCADPSHSNGFRCFRPSVSTPSCREEFVENPDNMLSIIKNANLSETHSVAGGNDNVEGDSEGKSKQTKQLGSKNDTRDTVETNASGRIVQIAPQEIRLRLRTRNSYSINMNYRKVEEYTVDLYYLMDLSISMKEDKENLYLLSSELTETMNDLSSDFRVGFGSFVDKVVMPYISTLPENLKEPCRGCAAPYGYKHSMALSRDTSQFSEHIKQATISGNLDAPEGGLDALLQSVVCREQIGWRQKAKKVLVLSTDAPIHIAGDGKLGGIVKPNDGNCHMDEYGIYTQSMSQDYPSIEQIKLAVKQNSVNVIFAVTKDNRDLYEELAKNMEGASVDELATDSSNIVDIVKNRYQQLSSIVELKHNASSAININFFTNCGNVTGELVNSNKCEDIKVGDTVQFRIDIEVVECPKNPKDYFQTIQIYPIGTNESLLVDLEMLCGCSCEHLGDQGIPESESSFIDS